MTKSFSINSIIYGTLAFLVSCTSANSKSEKQSAEKRQYTVQQNPVEVTVLQRGLFRKELVNNGKLVALRKCELQFRVGEQLEKLSVRNGDPVKVGYVIAQLNTAYSRTKSYDIAEMQRVSDQRSFGYYHSIFYDKNSQLFFRGYTKGGKATTDGLQIYKDGVLLADIDVQVGFKIVGSIKGTVYAQISDDYNENQRLVIYKIDIEKI